MESKGEDIMTNYYGNAYLVFINSNLENGEVIELSEVENKIRVMDFSQLQDLASEVIEGMNETIALYGGEPWHEPEGVNDVFEVLSEYANDEYIIYDVGLNGELGLRAV